MSASAKTTMPELTGSPSVLTASVSEALIQGISGTGRPMDMELLEDIVRTDAKGRYSFNEDRTLIRANQGHSIPVDVELTETAPPQVLYHGTASRFEQAILEQGLKPMSRLMLHQHSKL